MPKAKYREPTPEELRQALAAALTIRPDMRGELMMTREFLSEEGYPFAYLFKWNIEDERIEITRTARHA